MTGKKSDEAGCEELAGHRYDEASIIATEVMSGQCFFTE